jgi:hypothetical protein
VPTGAHPVQNELLRIRGYVEKLKKAENPKGEEMRKTELDIAASKRILVHELSSNKKSSTAAAVNSTSRKKIKVKR